VKTPALIILAALVVYGAFVAGWLAHPAPECPACEACGMCEPREVRISGRVDHVLVPGPYRMSLRRDGTVWFEGAEELVTAAVVAAGKE